MDGGRGSAVTLANPEIHPGAVVERLSCNASGDSVVYSKSEKLLY